MKFRQHRKEKDLDAEIRSHLDEAIRNRITQGESPEEAKANALREFGNVGLVKEVTREMWRGAWFEALGQDLRFGVRLLFKHKSFTVIAVLSLALGIGATTAIFSLLDALLWKTLPVSQPEQLVSVNGLGFAYPDAVYSELREKNSVFVGMFTFHALEMTMSDGNQAEPVLGELVSGDFYKVLGVAPHLGRVFNEADDQTPGAHFVTVLSYDFWQRRFGADPQIVGKQIKINNHSFTIVGVSARDFRHVEIGSAPAVRVPMMMKREMLDYIDTTPVMARLKEGVSLAQAQAATETLYQNILAPFGGNVRPANRRPIRLVPAETGVARGTANLRSQYAQSLLLLLGLVGAVLLIACLNVANLLLARGATRQKEIAMRLAVGAGRFRLVRQLLTEGFLLAALGGALGLLFARWGTAVLLGFLPPRATLEIEPDGRMLAFTLGVTVLTGLLFGLAPALQATRFDLIPALQNDAVGTASIARRWELRCLLVVLQVSLSLVLLVGGGLFARSLRNLRAVDHGYTGEQIATMEIALDRGGYTTEQQQNFYAQLRERVTALPGVQAATYLGWLPLNGGEGNEGEIETPGSQFPPNQKPTTLFYGISPQFFATFGISLQRGRDFNEQDRKTPFKSILVNDSFARAFFGAQNPLGKRISTGSFKDMEIVGVTSDAKLSNLKETMSRTIYYIQEPRHMGRQRLCVRATGDVAALMTAIRREMRSLDLSLPLYNVKTFDMHINESLSRERLIALLAGFFSLFALLLAALGLYGVMAYSVARRTREIGIRMALGAPAGNVLWLVLREMLWLVFIGIAIGLPAALAATKMTKGLLFGLSAKDPLTMTMAMSLLVGVALLAGYLPARRAARVDPVIALRHE